jgi:AraC-like DNA-binding protein
MFQDSSLYFRRSALLPHVEMRRADRSSACYQTHTHDEFSLGVIDAGSATYRNRQRQKTIHRGMTVMINPGEAHSCNPDAGQRWSYRMLFIDARWMARLQAAIPSLAGGDYVPFALSSSATAACYQQFDELFEVLEQDEDALAGDEKLICFLLRHGFAQRDLRLDRARPESQLERAKELIMDQLTENVTLDAIAIASGLSPYHLIRSFKQAYGQTPHAFQLDQRINRSKQLLKRGKTLVEVAQQLGFADQSHFQRHFKKRHALTPKVYQRALAA